MANYIKRNFEILFLKCWDFNYVQSCPWNDYMFEIIYDVGNYHGISIELVEISNIQLLNKYIEEYCDNKNLPICIDIDSYYCDWYKEYGKSHRIKYLILFGRQGKQYFCLDPHDNCNKHYLTTDNLLNEYKVANCYLYYPSTQNNNIETLTLLFKNHLNKLLLTNKGLNKISLYANQLKRTDVLTLLIDEEIYSNTFIINLEDVIFSRKNLSIFLKYYGNKLNQNYSKYDKYLRDILEHWIKFKNLCIKCRLINSIDVFRFEFMKEILYRVYVLEQELALDLKSNIEIL